MMIENILAGIGLYLIGFGSGMIYCYLKTLYKRWFDNDWIPIVVFRFFIVYMFNNVIDIFYYIIL